MKIEYLLQNTLCRTDRQCDNVTKPNLLYLDNFTQQAVDVSLGDGHVEVPEHLGLPGAPAVTLVDPGHLYGHVISCHHEKYQKLS